MKVGELIAELAKHDPDAIIVVDGYEGGYADPHMRRVKMIPNSGDMWGFGIHDDDIGSAPDKCVTAVCVSRKSPRSGTRSARA